MIRLPAENELVDAMPVDCASQRWVFQEDSWQMVASGVCHQV